MTSLITEYAGLTLKNPIIVAAGPWCRNGVSMQRAIDAGAAAVVTETITSDAVSHPSPRLFWDTQKGQMFNTMLYSDMPLEQWEQDFECLRRGDCKIIASIYGRSSSEISYLAGKVERMGADAVEISVSAPVGIRNEAGSSNPHEIYDYVRATVEAVEIPVIVKLSYEAANFRSYIDALKQAGAHGITAINCLKGLSGVDLETHRVAIPTYGGYSGAPIRPIALATIATLKQLTDLPICGCGGIQSAENVLEFMMLGASSVQLASVILREGYEVIARTLQELEQWLCAHPYDSIKAVIGRALNSLSPIEDIRPRPLTVHLTDGCDDCGKCTSSCLYDALNCSNNHLSVIPELCTSCGMCVSVCPHKAIQLCW